MSKDRDLEIAGSRIAPGEHKAIQLQFSESYLGWPVSVPVHVLRAAEEGPRIFITAAVHGDELNGLGIIRELIFESSLELQRGTLIVVPVVNTLGLERHARYLPDRRDLNRCFPGSPEGSLSSRLANAVFQQIISVCDYGVDLHTAAVRRTNYPTLRGDFGNPQALKLAQAFGAEILVHSKGPKGSLRRTATDSGVPTVIFEAGEVWKIEPAVVNVGATGCLNILRDLDMVDLPPSPQRPQVRINKTQWIRAEQGGLVSFQARPGDVVAKGQELALTYSVFGRDREVLSSPVNGVVIGMTTLPVVKPGGPVYHIGVLSKKQMGGLSKRNEEREEDNPFAKVHQDLATSIAVQSEEGNDEAGSA